MVVAAAAALFIVFVVVLQQRGAREVEGDQQQAATQRALDKVADPLARLCATDTSVRDRVGDEACSTAAEAVAVPGPTGPAGPGGPEGPVGAAGRGIVSTTLRDDGHLLVTYSDGTQNDVGSVVGIVGTPGAPGAEGPAGVGISASTIASGRLILTFSDGTTRDLGPIVGERGADGDAGPAGADGAKGDPGRGIASTEIVADRLVITYDDGATEDAGPVPAGPAGPEGPAGSAEPPDSFTFTYSEGGRQTCERTGGDASAPTYRCTGADGPGDPPDDPGAPVLPDLSEESAPGE